MTAHFPLFAHQNGQWAKKIGGKLHYFGVDRQAALRKYEASVLADTARNDPLQLSVLVTSFMTSRRRLLDSGEIKTRTYLEYQENCDRVMRVLGRATIISSLGPLDFERLRADFASTHKPPTLCGDIARTKVLFGYAADTFDIRVRYGRSFKKPSQATLRKHRQSQPAKLFTAEEVRHMIDKAGVQLRAMILLGINCGFGNHDCATLDAAAIDWTGWISHPRPKTGIMRRCPLWPETVNALQAAIECRPKPKDTTHAGRAFITRYGFSWEPKAAKGDSPISKEFTKLGIHRKGVGFYALRHTFQTIGNRARDKDAVRAIMGHVPPTSDMSAAYTEEPVDGGAVAGGDRPCQSVAARLAASRVGCSPRSAPS